jgi:transcriptional regulator with XRE-family HTH domain
VPTPFDGPSSAEPSDRHELGDFLRSRRSKLTPKSVGLPEGVRRRTAGLRREEVAQLAGIGVDWYVRLEQGRSVTPSTSTVDALARVLRLSKVEHAHLRQLTQVRDRPPFRRESVPPAVQRVVEALDQPAYITGRRWDVLAWNAAADDILGFSRVPEEERNTLISMLTKRRMRRLFGVGWEDEARRMVAQFRAAYDLWSGDPAFVQLYERLKRESPELAGWWRAHDVGAARSGEKRIYHPKKGAMRFEYASFQANDDPALKLVIFTRVRAA